MAGKSWDTLYRQLGLPVSELANKNREKNRKKINKIAQKRKRIVAEADEDYGLS